MAQLDAEQQAEMKRLKDEKRKKIKEMQKAASEYERKFREKQRKTINTHKRRNMAHELMDIEYGIEDAKRLNVAKGGSVKKYSRGGGVRKARF